MNNDNKTNLFSLTVSFTGTQFTVDSNELNTLTSAIGDNLEARKKLINIEEAIKDAYKTVTPLMKELLSSIFGDVEESCVHSVSESTIFFTKEE